MKATKTAAIITNAATTVAVRGFAEREVDPDFASISFSVGHDHTKSSEALAGAGKLAGSIRAVIAAAPGARESVISRIRVRRRQHWAAKKKVWVNAGHTAAFSGSVDVDSARIAALVTQLVAAGAQISWVGWGLDSDNAVFRETRTLAVADAHRAALDFANAVGGTLGALSTLADPGLLAAGHRESEAHDRLEVLESRSVGWSQTPEPGEIELDPEPQTVNAHVEACYFMV